MKNCNVEMMSKVTLNKRKLWLQTEPGNTDLNVKIVKQVKNKTYIFFK